MNTLVSNLFHSFRRGVAIKCNFPVQVDDRIRIVVCTAAYVQSLWCTCLRWPKLFAHGSN